MNPIEGKIVIRPAKYRWLVYFLIPSPFILIAVVFPFLARIEGKPADIIKNSDSSSVEMLLIVCGVWIFSAIYLILQKITIASEYITKQSMIGKYSIKCSEVYYLKLSSSPNRFFSINLYSRSNKVIFRIDTMNFSFDALRDALGWALRGAPIGQRLTWCRRFQKDLDSKEA